MKNINIRPVREQEKSRAHFNVRWAYRHKILLAGFPFNCEGAKISLYLPYGSQISDCQQAADIVRNSRDASSLEIVLVPNYWSEGVQGRLQC